MTRPFESGTVPVMRRMPGVAAERVPTAGRRGGVAGKMVAGVRTLCLGVVVLLSLVLNAAVALPASADGGDLATEGSVMVQQGLSYLVNEPGADGTAQALTKVDDVLAADDQDGVDVGQVQQARTALQAGRPADAQALLQASISEASANAQPATGGESGTTVVMAPVEPPGLSSVLDWVLLVGSLSVGVLGVVLGWRLRPRLSLRELTRQLKSNTSIAKVQGSGGPPAGAVGRGEKT